MSCSPKIDFLNILGTGSSSIVYKSIVNGKAVAIKLSSHPASDWQIIAARNVHAIIHPHSNIIECLGFVDIKERPGILLELNEDAMNLKKYVDTRGNLELKEIIKVAADIASALCHMHKCGVSHNDVRMANVMYLQKENHAKLIDFCMATIISDDKCGERTPRSEKKFGPSRFTAPEINTNAPEGIVGTSEKSDVYVFGGFLFELLEGKYPWFWTEETLTVQDHVYLSNYSSYAQFFNHHLMDHGKVYIRFTETHPKLSKIVYDCLHINIEERPTMKSVQERLVHFLI